MKLLDIFTESKSGNPTFNEDGVYFKAPFAVVIDGTTTKDGKLFCGMYGGRFAMQVITEAMSSISESYEPYRLLKEINNALALELESKNLEFSPSAGILIYNDARKELISYGDNPYSINGKEYRLVKESDKIASNKRAETIKALLRSGMTVEEIQKNDLGRKEIIGYLKEISEKCANVEQENGYPVINGKGIIESFIKVHKIEAGSELILASDGYPKLFGTLSETEFYLQELLKKDVLCIEELQGTKGVAFGNVSFDDRSYLRFVT